MKPGNKKIKCLNYNTGSNSGIIAFSTRRDTDFPDLPYSGFNACYYTHGDPIEVAACRDSLLDMLPGITRLIMPRQEHTANVIDVDTNNNNFPVGIDGIITQEKGIALAINTADCVPILLFDPAAKVIGAVHSGWRGTIGHIAVKAVNLMIEKGASRSDLKVIMGPSICTNCFEVGHEVASLFENQFGSETIMQKAEWTRPHVDLKRAISIDLGKSGINKDNISLSTPCSHCEYQTWWSARKMGINSGRTLSVIAIID